MTRRILAAALALTAVLGLTTAAGATASTLKLRPLPNGVPRSEARRLADSGPFGDCAVTGVVCKPDIAGSCTGTTSQTSAPASIRVYDHTYSGPNHIRVVPFETYVEDVLPNEWLDSWDGDSLKAGAVAITSYAWYWITHFGGYVGTNSKATCFDVTDDENFQVFVNNSAASYPNSVSKVQQVFPSAIRVDNAVLQASYSSALDLDTYDPNDPSTYDRCGQGADGTFLSQSGSETCNEDNTANKWPVILKLYYGQNIQLASTAQLRSQHDFQYLHHSTPATFVNGTWSIGDGYPTRIRFGMTGDVPVVNTVGDGFARVGVYRPSNNMFYLGSPTGTITRTVRFGIKGDLPVAAQYLGLTSPTQLAVFRPSNGVWYFATTTGGIQKKITYGQRGDVPVPGRWRSSTADSVAVFRPSTARWYRYGVTGSVQYGAKGDIPAPADYTDDGRTDIAVYRPSNHTFYVRGHAGVQWGIKGDVPVTGDFNGDGKADFAIYRPSKHTVYVRGVGSFTVGTAAGTPIGKAPYAD